VRVSVGRFDATNQVCVNRRMPPGATGRWVSLSPNEKSPVETGLLRFCLEAVARRCVLGGGDQRLVHVVVTGVAVTFLAVVLGLFSDECIAGEEQGRDGRGVGQGGAGDLGWVDNTGFD
jgi:hypothetical protein